MVSFYDLFMVPLEKRGIRKTRQKLLQEACGTVLEIGAGTGVNVKYYQPTCIDELIITDQKVGKHLKQKHQPHISFKEARAEHLPFDDNTFDTVVHTLVFCCVNDVDQGLQEVKRVLKPDGKLLFIEHVLPHKQGLRRLFRSINPLWRLFSSGCSLTKDFKKSLNENGFDIQEQGQFMNTVFIYGTATHKRS
ncbi:class I SAM-dependent methyltransferase [Candidatus Xianfuyuplasma coldseepsis]|uniref:Class I SAM-dependent methyltransferase n=1 Tax=Candidatus Xianfuyuplasma coldseepsis TaxID=2782163 RepID=A0A7L7KUA4_9MOLU|nr:class I SAM-dependent methyltransferase [Xianfuyuplasma coldseepsis]QMS85584.1 class I SAM-dependent methyltransferase [Xianfuyuplasma coldseepsis]